MYFFTFREIFVDTKKQHLACTFDRLVVLMLHYEKKGKWNIFLNTQKCGDLNKATAEGVTGGIFGRKMVLSPQKGLNWLSNLRMGLFRCRSGQICIEFR